MDSRKPIEGWAQEKGTAAWLFAAAKALRAWAVGQEVSEQDFDEAVADAGSVAIGVTSAR